MKLINTLLPAVITAFTLLGTACSTTTDADGNPIAASERECRTFDTKGSKMKRSECRTKEEWAAIDQAIAERRENDPSLDDFFRRQVELGAQGAGPTFDSPTGR